MNEEASHNEKDSELDALFWKDEIMQVMYWLEGEELAQSVPAKRLLVFLNTNLETLLMHLKKGVEQGYLAKDSDVYSEDTCFNLSDSGKEEAGTRFAEAFEGMRKQGHGECGPECICQWEGKEACEHGHYHDLS